MGPLLNPIQTQISSADFTAAAIGGTVVNVLGTTSPSQFRTGIGITNHSATDYLLVKQRKGSSLSTITVSSAHYWIPPRSTKLFAAGPGVAFDAISSTGSTIAGTAFEYQQ